LTDYSVYSTYALSSVTMSSLSLTSVSCANCNSYLIVQAANDLSISDLQLDTINKEVDLEISLDTALAGVFAFYHVPDSSVTSLSLISGSTSFSKVYGSVLAVYLEDYSTTTEYTYTITAITVDKLYQILPSLGLFAFFNNLV